MTFDQIALSERGDWRLRSHLKPDVNWMTTRDHAQFLVWAREISKHRGKQLFRVYSPAGKLQGSFSDGIFKPEKE